jgi:hypothetical protein
MDDVMENVEKLMALVSAEDIDGACELLTSLSAHDAAIMWTEALCDKTRKRRLFSLRNNEQLNTALENLMYDRNGGDSVIKYMNERNKRV